MTMLTVVTLVLAFAAIVNGKMTNEVKGNILANNDPETHMDALQMIHRWGYKGGEEHAVVTEDGYILTIHRIAYGKSGPTNGTRPVFFMQHGLECSSTNWIANLPYQSAGFMFADAGFDVWLGNFRGNTYGLRHVNLTTKDHAFWEFSYDEMAQYDLTAMIDYILKHTGQTQVYYMGHSQGTMTAFAQFSQDPVFSTKTRMPVYMSHTPAGTSSQNIVHFGQGVSSHIFRKYDWGSKILNEEHYGPGKTTPPAYDLTKVSVPTYLFWSTLDLLADPQDVKTGILPYLDSSVLKGNFEYKDFNHLDFIWGLRASNEIYSKILDIVKAEDAVPAGN